MGLCYTFDMSLRQYRRNGTPIGKHDVYALSFSRGERTQVYVIEPHGIETYEDLDVLVKLEMIEGKFGSPDRLVITGPGVDLSKSDLTGVMLSNANLSGANLSDSTLSFSSIPEANLTGANLHRVDLTGANMLYSKLSGADLRGAELGGADLGGCKWDSDTKWPTGFTPPPSRDGYRPNRRR